MKVTVSTVDGSIEETIERSTRDLAIAKTLMLVRDYLKSYNEIKIKVDNSDCIDCNNWDLYCKLGKDKYYWCRTHNKIYFEGVG